MGDSELVAEALRGRGEAFGQLSRKYSRLVASIAMARLGSPGELEDVLQEVFARAWASLGRLREPDKFASWLSGITRWVCSEKIQNQVRHRAWADGQGSSCGEEAEEPFAFSDRSDRHQDLLAAVEKLPAIYREALALLYFEDMSYDEISRALGISKAGVNFRLTKARAMLRRELVR